MRTLLSLCTVTVLLASAGISAQPSLAIPPLENSEVIAQNSTQITPQAALERVFSAPQIEEAWFAPEFLAEVPFSELQEGRTFLEQELGSYQEIRQVGQTYRLVFERGQLDAAIQLNSEGQISGLLLREAT
ncbi:MAG: hypothetical protein SFY66_04455 [Oculatellaceae cyanobacterium bins.114]|nr:hypothetical protein [Oculatellaceae cyanobacterium bins.114]